MIEEKAYDKKYILHRIEDGPHRLLKKLSINEQDCFMSEDCNSFKHRKNKIFGFYSHTEQDIRMRKLFPQLQKLASKYGYEL
jgi:hypothetical protein